MSDSDHHEGRPRTTARDSELVVAQINFDPARLTLARQLRGLTKVELAEQVGVSTAAISQHESGKARPGTAVLGRIAFALRFPVAFFEAGRPIAHVSEDATNFRRLRSVSRRSRNRLLARLGVLAEIVAVLDDHVELPPVSVPGMAPASGERSDIEAVASALRREWGMGLEPIDSIVRLLEVHGVLVAQLTSENDGVDAFSLRLGDRPVIVLVKDKADAARSNFDAAHELGHLVLHHDAEPANVVREQEANAFASAFLMPTEPMMRELPVRVDWRALLELKRRWRVSVQALLYRARTLGSISESAYKRAMVRVSAAGWRTNEPSDLGEPERPTVLTKALAMVEEAGLLSRDDLVRQLRLTTELLEEFAPSPPQRPRVVVG